MDTSTSLSAGLNAGLPQALSDGTYNYIYGVDRIAQTQGGITEYFLADALGSVRQITDASAQIAYVRAYDPYGVVTTTTGSSQSAYGYTNEYSSQGLIYLRARYYDPAMGRFLTRDTWEGDVKQPISYNAWVYVNGNPIIFTDPSGHIPQYCDPYGWCREFTASGFHVSLTTNVKSISANLYDPKGNRMYSQQFTGDVTKNGLCGFVAFAAIYRTQNPSLTGNEIYDELNESGIETNWVGRDSIARMAEHFGWEAIWHERDGSLLKLAGGSGDRRSNLFSFINDGWVPILALQTDSGYLKLSGSTPHWISVVGIGIDHNNWFVDVYNPVNDRVTQYPWGEFYTYLSREYVVTEKVKGKTKKTTLNVNPLVLIRHWK